mmetsp:Transcript_6751/g.16467  ORF Transcript_6751/g.16467 Transcript_6751/m.16467 type:complete len:432 (+) Transcript_6751:41-1336(+)
MVLACAVRQLLQDPCHEVVHNEAYATPLGIRATHHTAFLQGDPPKVFIRQPSSVADASATDGPKNSHLAIRGDSQGMKEDGGTACQADHGRDAGNREPASLLHVERVHESQEPSHPRVIVLPTFIPVSTPLHIVISTPHQTSQDELHGMQSASPAASIARGHVVRNSFPARSEHEGSVHSSSQEQLKSSSFTGIAAPLGQPKTFVLPTTPHKVNIMLRHPTPLAQTVAEPPARPNIVLNTRTPVPPPPPPPLPQPTNIIVQAKAEEPQPPPPLPPGSPEPQAARVPQVWQDSPSFSPHWSLSDNQSISSTAPQVMIAPPYGAPFAVHPQVPYNQVLGHISEITGQLEDMIQNPSQTTLLEDPYEGFLATEPGQPPIIDDILQGHPTNMLGSSTSFYGTRQLPKHLGIDDVVLQAAVPRGRCMLWSSFFPAA